MGDTVVRSRRAALCAAGVASLCAAVAVLYSLAEYSIPAGPYAHDSPCDDVVARLPQVLIGRERDSVAGAGTAGWGDGSIVLRCGVEPLAPTINTCMNVNGFDWVLDDERAKKSEEWVFTTYDREPAVAIAFKGRGQLAGDALASLGSDMASLNVRKSTCLSLSDT
ncbi:DUF3515 family protein [Streptomyces sp. NPDC088097]|uniref:DUF3515 family protein n=1 Tax=Streptomyces sp. NPDC088097 TaxID=3365823 RepID=UPI00380984F1